MKKSMKKYLMLILVIVAMVVAAISVSAASSVSVPDTIICNSATCQDEDGNGTVQKAKLGIKYEPQCEAEGYTEILCANCGTYYGSTGAVDPLGHLLAIKDYTPDESGTYFQKNMKCTRFGCQYGINKNEPECGDDFKEVKYCKVNFINDFVAVKFESEAFCPYATLAAVDEEDAYKTETETIYVEYPADDTSALVTASAIPYRMADKNFGKYIFAGWLDKEAIKNAGSTSGTQTFAQEDAVTFRLRYDTESLIGRDVDENNKIVYNGIEAYEALIAKAKLAVPAVTATTPAEYDLYAIFSIDTAVKHSVKFYNYDGTLLLEDEADHGITPLFYTGDEPRRPDNLEYTYKFRYWELLGTPIKMSAGENGYKIGHVYGDLKLSACYDPAIIRQYKFKYFQKDGVTPISDTVDTVTLAGFDDEKLTPKYGLSLGKVDSYFDSAYHYVHTGKWLIPSRGNYVVDLNNVTLPYGTLDSTQIDYIALVPQYQSFLRMYTLVVKIVYDDNDKNYHPKVVKLQVTDASGKVIGYAEVDQSEEYYKDGTYTVPFDVAYSERYTVSATSTGFSGKADTGFHTFDPDISEDDKPGNITVELKKVEGDPCNCICHTVFKPVWVGILNLLNSLFKLEFVCCDDMFANIGSELNYGHGIVK